MRGAQALFDGGGYGQNAPDDGYKPDQQKRLGAHLVLAHDGGDSPEKLREDEDQQDPVQDLQSRFERPTLRRLQKAVTAEKKTIPIVTSRKSAAPK